MLSSNRFLPWTIAAGSDFLRGSVAERRGKLVECYAVSRTTVRQTIQNLIRRGLIEIRRGKGTLSYSRRITQESTQLSGFVKTCDLSAATRPHACSINRLFPQANP